MHLDHVRHREGILNAIPEGKLSLRAAFPEQGVFAGLVTQRAGVEAIAGNFRNCGANITTCAAVQGEVVTRGQAIAEDFQRQR